MNTNILKKCVEELKKDTFSKEYVLGMLETIIEVSSVQITHPIATQETYYPTQHATQQTEDIPDYLKTGPVGRITN